jgi:transcriptional regulator with XRE-family HTH domain
MARSIDFELAPIDEIEAELGRRLESARLAANISQAGLAAEAGVSRRTITRIENGEGVSVETLIRIMRALRLAGRLDGLLPEPGIRPIERIRMKGRQRQRARSSSGTPGGEWAWGDTDDASDAE